MQVTRRQFFSIAILIFMVFFAFIATESAKEVLGDYEHSEYDISDVERVPVQEAFAPVENKDDYVVFYGNANSIEKVARQWSLYRKMGYKRCGSVQELFGYAKSDKKPYMVLIQGSSLAPSDYKAILAINEADIDIVFCDMPTDSAIKQSNVLLEMLGIISVQNQQVEVDGIHLLNDFFIGGEKYYMVDEDEDDPEKLALQDLQTTMCWYTLSAGTKTYMVGIFYPPENPEDKIDNEYLPPVIWRHRYNDAFVFAVNSDFMFDTSGIGILSAFAKESHDYDIYPVVNAQNVVIANVPIFTDENSDVMFDIYNRDISVMLRDILWTGISTITENHKSHTTCMVSPQLDYSDDLLPQNDLVHHFERQLRQQHSEAGLSFTQVSDVPIMDKLAEDRVFFDGNMANFKFMSAYIEDYNPVEAAEALKKSGFGDVRALVSDYNSTQDLISYVDDDTILFTSVNEGTAHSYRDDFRERSVETALGYSTVTANLQNVVYPTDTKDEWQEVYDNLSSNLGSYYDDFTMFDQTAVSEADTKARKFLKNTFSYTEDEDEVVIRSTEENMSYICRFRTRNVKKITGGDYTKLDNNSYLITVEGTACQVILEPDNEIVYK